MRYRVTALSPLLVGDGRRLSPIDYMVWKDQVSVLDQRRIFRLLAKGPRLEGYLLQLKRADKLDFASWGGFAQNYADRRLPFESPAYSAVWNRASGDSLQIPTFAAGVAGPYLPGAALKGALRTAWLYGSLKPEILEQLARGIRNERVLRNPGEALEERLLGDPGQDRMRWLAAGDSVPQQYANFKVYLLRTASLQTRGGALSLGWKQSPRGTADGRRPEEGTPAFAEMASSGTAFEGAWSEREFFAQPEVRRALGWPQGSARARLFEAANEYAAALLALHRTYAETARLDEVGRAVGNLEERLAAARAAGACLVCLGWGGGLLSKCSWLDTSAPAYRETLRALALYQAALLAGLPFPKTRRVVFLNNQPSTLAGWALLEIMA
ncbi:MAG: type III-A CRISPR-associated RAMP protein Csm5 [Acidobacteria bacterium]|nr:type III-A CRISPR-associated RAMP protein Csm5 [Acidobacteriota bacterium]